MAPPLMTPMPDSGRKIWLPSPPFEPAFWPCRSSCCLEWECPCPSAKSRLLRNRKGLVYKQLGCLPLGCRVWTWHRCGNWL